MTENESPAPRPSGERHIALRALAIIDRGLGLLEVLVVGASILLMAVIMCGHVAGRLFFGAGIPGAFEMTQILIVLITFVGLSYGVRSARHISMSAIYDQLSGRARKGLLVVISIGTGVLMFYIAWEALAYTLQIYERGRTTSALQLKLWIVYMVLPIGFALAGVQYWLTAVRNLTTEGMWRSFDERERYAEVPEEDHGGPTAGGGRAG